MKIVLTGMTASGKSTTQKILCEKYNLNKIVTFTTRPPRFGEVDGVDYNFVSCETFLELIDEDYFLEYKEYITCDNVTGEKNVKWYYGTSKVSMTKDNTCVVLTPSGLQALKDNNIDHISFYLDVDENSLRQKQIERCDNVLEAERRLKADKDDFSNIFQEVDFIIDNHLFKYSSDTIANEIMLDAIDIVAKTYINSDGLYIRKPEYIKKVYISHAFSGLETNIKRTSDIINSLMLEYPTYIFYSPIHAFSFAYYKTNYQDGLDLCFDMLTMCDEMWIFDYEHFTSKGVNAEIDFCKTYNIPYKIFDDYELNILGIEKL